MKIEPPVGPTKLNLLCHGMSGSGKTVFSGTAASCGKVIIADIEAGLMSIADKVTSGAVEAVKIEKYQDFTNMVFELKGGKHGYETLVVDSGTELQKLYLDMVGGDKDMPTLQDYGKLANETRKSLRFLRDLPMNLIYITLSKDEKDEQFGSIIRKPSLTGKLPEDACGYMDLVLYITTKEVDGKLERIAITQPTERLVAKDRSGKLERYEAPDFAAIYNKIFPAKPKGKGGKGA